MDMLLPRLSRRTKQIFLFILLFMIVVHGYRYFNPGFSHDSLAFAAESDGPWKISLGRFMQPVYWKLRGYIASPLTVGLLSILWLALAAQLIVRLLGIRSLLGTALACGVLASGQSLISTNVAYMHETDTFMLALLLACAAAWLILRARPALLPVASAALCLCAGLYQSFLQVFILLVMADALQGLLCARGPSVRDILLRCLRGVLALLLGLALYFALCAVTIRLSGVGVSSSDNSIANLAHFSGASIPALCVQAYRFPFEYLLRMHTRNSLVAKAGIVCVLLFGLAGVGVLIRRRGDVLRGVLSALIVAALPFAACCIYVVTKGNVHELMLYALCLLPLMALRAIEAAFGQSRRAPVLCALPVLALCAVLFDKAVFSNQLYLKEQLEYDATLSVMTRVVDRLEQLEGYVPGETPVALIGDINLGPLANERPAFEYMNDFLGAEFVYAPTFEATYEMYLRDVMGYAVDLIADVDIVAQTEQGRALTIFPDAGCAAMIDGIATIKLSHW